MPIQSDPDHELWRHRLFKTILRGGEMNMTERSSRAIGEYLTRSMATRHPLMEARDREGNTILMGAGDLVEQSEFDRWRDRFLEQTESEGWRITSCPPANAQPRE